MTTLMVRDPLFAKALPMDEFFHAGGNGDSATGFTPLLDVHETPDEHLVMVDLPGVRSEDVTIPRPHPRGSY